MGNQKEFDELAMNVDSLMSIQQDLVREFKDNYGNPSPQLITSINNLSAELKAVQDRLSKVKIDEGLSEPSSGFTPKIDADLKVTPTTVEEGNCRSTPKIDCTDINGAGATNSVRDYKVRSKFIDYQEGKPFFSEYNSLNVVSNYQVNVTNIEAKDFKWLNQNSITEFEQFEDRRVITDVKLTHSTSCIFQFLKLLSRQTTSVVVLSSYDSVYMLFDRGKEFDESILRNKYANDFVYNPELQLEYVTAHEVLDQGLARDISFQTQKGQVQKGFVTTTSNPSENGLNCTSMSGLILICAGSRKCLGDILVVSRKLFDRGKLCESKMRYSYHLKSNAHFSPGTLTFSLIVLDMLVFMDTGDGKYVYELKLGVGYPLGVSFEHADVSEIVKRGETHDAFQLFDEVPQQVGVHWNKVILNMTKKNRSSNSHQILNSDLIHHNWSFNGNNGLMPSQKWMHAETTTSLHCIFEFYATKEVRLEQFLKQDYHPTVAWSSQVIKVYKLGDGVPWFQGYPLMVVSLIVKSYDQLLKLKKGYRGVEICERIVKIKRLLVGANGGKSITKVMLEETCSGSGDTRSVILHLMCRLISDLFTHSLIQGNGELQNFSDKITDYVAGSSSTVGVWKISLKEIKYLQVFLISIPTAVKGHIYISEIMFLPTPEIYESFSIRARGITQIVSSTWSCLYLFHYARYCTSCYNLMVGVNTSYPTRCLLPCYSSLRSWVYEATKSYSGTSILASFKGTRNSGGVDRVVDVLLGFPSSSVCSCGKWRFSWVENVTGILLLESTCLCVLPLQILYVRFSSLDCPVLSRKFYNTLTLQVRGEVIRYAGWFVFPILSYIIQACCFRGLGVHSSPEYLGWKEIMVRVVEEDAALKLTQICIPINALGDINDENCIRSLHLNNRLSVRISTSYYFSLDFELRFKCVQLHTFLLLFPEEFKCAAKMRNRFREANGIFHGSLLALSRLQKKIELQLEILKSISISGSNYGGIRNTSDLSPGLTTDSFSSFYYMKIMSVSILKNILEKFIVGNDGQLLLFMGSKSIDRTLGMGRVKAYGALQVLQLFSQHKWCHRKIDQDVDGVTARYVSPGCEVSSYYYDTLLVAAGRTMGSMAYPYWLQLYMGVLLQLRTNHKPSVLGAVIQPWAKKFLRRNQLEYFKKMSVEKNSQQLPSIRGVYKISQQHFVLLLLLQYNTFIHSYCTARGKVLRRLYLLTASFFKVLV